MSALVDYATARAERLASAPPAVEARGVSKSFLLPHQRYSTFKERALHPFQARTYDELRAVQDVSLSIAQGEFFGIAGRNGSGKSTMLKLLAGIYKQDRGDIRIAGRLSPFIELGVGFNPDLTARDNVTINAIILGLTRRQARQRFDDIIEFAGLEEFVDLKLKNYSSGMVVRLAFSVAVEVDADVLLVDEVLAVGDAAFQQKCFQQFQRMKDDGRTIVFVSHDMSAVQRFCDRAMLLERGKVVTVGEPEAIARAYNEINFGTISDDRAALESAGDVRGAEIVDAWFEDADGRRIAALAQGQDLRLCVEILAREDLEDPVVSLYLRNDVRHTIFATSSREFYGPTGRFTAGERVVARVRLENWLAPSVYTLTATVSAREAGAELMDIREDIASLTLHATRFTGGVIDIPHEYHLERR